MAKRTDKLAGEDELGRELDEALASIGQLHYSLPPLGQYARRYMRNNGCILALAGADDFLLL
jgi:hypothetical protein